MAQVKRAFASTPAGQVHYLEQGHGETVLLLHPTGLSSRGYLGLMRELGGCRLLAPDLPGCGFSDPLPEAVLTVPSMEAFATMVADFMDALDISTAHVFGAHLGNKIGAALAARHPDRVRSCFFTGHTHSIMLEAAQRNVSFPELDALAGWAGAGPGTRDAQAWQMLLDEVTALWQGAGPDVEGRSATRLQQAHDEVLCRILCEQSYGAMYKANFAFDLRAAALRITAPVHVLELVVPQEATLPRQSSLWVASLPGIMGVLPLEKSTTYVHAAGRAKPVQGV